MLVSLKAKLAYLAMPKTGSTAVEKALGPLCDLKFHRAPSVKHTSFRKFSRYIDPYLRSFGVEVETVCVVREPVSWLRSWYTYRRRDAISGHDHSTKGVDFAGFVEAYLSDSPPPFARVGRQSEFVTGPGTSPGVDHMFRHDDMERLAAFLSQRVRAPIVFDQVNVSPPISTDLPDALRLRLEREREADFALYAGLARRAAA